MSNSYALVQWNRHKKVYDLIIVLAIAAYLLAFIAIGKLIWRGPQSISTPILLMRALGTCGIVMLHIILSIGPLARLDHRFAPLLYNRRHLGVSMFLIALAHAVLATLYYGAYGTLNPIVATLGRAAGGSSISGFPFEWPGFLALLILFLMAATSHDFWLANLTPRVWKMLHMFVYCAYCLLILHIALGALQSERSPAYPILMALGIVLVSSLHILAGRRERAAQLSELPLPPAEQWIDVGAVEDIADSRARIVCLKDRQRIAVFRYNGKISAVSSICAHQGGPLGEGKIVGGCITCPWHGYQYLPDSGRSPPPFTEKIPTYEVRVQGRRIFVNPKPLPAGTPVEPAIFPALILDREPAHAP
jgi:methionine sulfoxide reductase heme-binding subunit